MIIEIVLPMFMGDLLACSFFLVKSKFIISATLYYFCQNKQDLHHLRKPVVFNRDSASALQGFHQRLCGEATGKLTKGKQTIHTIYKYTSILSILLPFQRIYTTIFATNISSNVSSSYILTLYLSVSTLSLSSLVYMRLKLLTRPLHSYANAMIDDKCYLPFTEM